MRASIADAICAELIERGVNDVFGLPGSQTIDLWEALRRSRLRTIVATNELSAAFMAGGYARASGQVGVLVTIGDPGFAFAVPGIVEAQLDSVPLLHLATPSRRVAAGPAGEFQQGDIARRAMKAVFEPARPGDVGVALHAAYSAATRGEPGPALVQIPPEVLRAAGPIGVPTSPAPADVPGDAVREIVERLRAAERPLLFCGNGAAAAARDIAFVAEQLSAPVLTSTSGRGVIPETHPLSIAHDVPGSGAEILNDLIAGCDLVLVLGCRLSDNSTLGQRLRLPADRLVRVDASEEVMRDGPYPAQTAIVCDVPALLRAVAIQLERAPGERTWTNDEIAGWKQRLEKTSRLTLPEPKLAGVEAREFFAAFRNIVPTEIPIATDSGLHQYLVRSYLRVLAPRTLLVPADFQSMGFGIPTAMGAAIATNGPAVAIVGDGGFAINGSELLTAVREGLALAVLVVVDRQLGLIRAQQLQRTGKPTGVDLSVPDLELFARSVGADYLELSDGDPGLIGDCLSSGRVTVVELPATDAPGLGRAQARGLMVAAGRRLLRR